MLRSLLDDVTSEGKALIGQNNPQKATAWYMRAKNAFAIAFPADSELRRALDACEKAASSAGGTNYVSPEAVDVAKIASQQEFLSNGERSVSELQRDVALIIHETFLRSPWVKVPVVILLAAVGFAIGGVIQLANINVDINKRADSSLKNVEQQIEQKKQDTAKSLTRIADDARDQVSKALNAELKTHVDVTKKSISEAADSYVKELRAQKTPDLEAAFATSRYRVGELQQQLTAAEKRLAQAQEQIAELNRALRQINHATAGGDTLTHLSAALSRSRMAVIVEVTAIALAVALSAFAAVFSFRNRRA